MVRKRLLTYIDQLKYSEFIKKLDKQIKQTKIVNFDMTHKRSNP